MIPHPRSRQLARARAGAWWPTLRAARVTLRTDQVEAVAADLGVSTQAMAALAQDRVADLGVAMGDLSAWSSWTGAPTLPGRCRGCGAAVTWYAGAWWEADTIRHAGRCSAAERAA